ncbi:hypothetical protein OPT61_g3223 [Boeremia exigua]|uniref:Uncharacterized protein n=1 Tax=Boeremia exigua TaxID=749465 RepID=A0ACC2IIQ1_9PLEO|nr:hypothetical protein OPT61_g3223 [Boeremia exigua]
MSNTNRPRRFPRPTSARTFPEAYYNERHAPTEYPRVDPYGYPMGGPVVGLRNRADEFQPEQGGSRRRIAVACARCRKRKIRCSGDAGDGGGCQNCKVAGVDASQCQFHRVGSDHVQTVMDSYSMAQSLTNMASANNMMPLYSTGSDGPYHRNAPSQSFSPLETRFAYPPVDANPTYSSEWTAAYEGDTSPIDDYGFDRSSPYLPPTPTQAAAGLCALSYQWTPQPVRPSSNYYSDYGQACFPNDMPYLQTNIAPVTSTEPVSPLNMSSLQLTLPERPRQRQMQPTEVPVTPRRRLPVPQPRAGHGLHHALDQQQDQRLRSSQAVSTPLFRGATPSYTNAGSFAKPLLPWTAANENLMNAVNEATCAAVSLPIRSTPKAKSPRNSAVAKDDASTPFPVRKPARKSLSTADMSSSNGFNFNTMPLLDPTIATAPPLYSNFRESRDLFDAATPGQLSRDGSSSSLYTYSAIPRSLSFPTSGSSSNLVSGRRYSPLSQPIDTSGVENDTKESFETQSSPMCRASSSSLSSSS